MGGPDLSTTDRWDRRSTVTEILQQWRWSSAQVVRHALAPALGLAALELLAGFGPAASVRVTQRVINLAIASAGHGVAGFAPLLPWLGVLACVTILTRGPIWDLRRPLDQRTEQRLTHRLGRERLGKAERLPLLFFESSDHYDQLSRSAHAGQKVFEAFKSGLSFAQGAVTVVTIALLFRPVSPWLAVGLVAAVLPQALWGAEVNRRWMSFTYGQTESQRRTAYVGGLLTGRGEQKELRVFGLRGPLQERWRGLRRELRFARMGEKRRAVLDDLPTSALGLATLVGTAVFLAVALADHRINAGAFVALFGGVGAMDGGMNRLTFGVRDLQTNATDVGYVRAFLSLPESPRPAAAADGAAFPRPLRDGIRLEGVRFTYPGRTRPVLDDLCLHLRPGQCVALVGPNGCGKSTLVKLLLGLYPPEAGRITADGVDYRDLAPSALHHEVSAVFQDYVRFAFTAGQGIGVGRIAASHDAEAVAAAARQGGADGFISALPRGYDTPVGHILPGGMGLSGGQWQRIAISRAFMRQPQLLILDEPTASLDPQAEAEVYEHFADLLAGRATLLISHRLGSARLADRILVLHEGRIAEDGTHADLLGLGGLYARMWEEQAQWYR